MPHFPTHPAFVFGLTKLHGEIMGPDGMSSSADSIAFSGHTGTHVDALGHFSCAGFVYGGVEVKQSYTAGLNSHDAEAIQPFVTRGVLLDIARLHGADALNAEDEISADDLESAAREQRTDVKQSDVVLLRTGWGRYFSDAKRYLNNTQLPGASLNAAQWISARKVVAAGSDTLAFEKLPSAAMPVHVHLLVKSGIHILENLNLEELAAAKVYEFRFIGASLKIRGGTGAPIRPLAIIE